MPKIRSQRQLAAALGVVVSTVSGYLQRPDCPVPAKGPWDDDAVARLRAWRANLQEDRSGKAASPAPEAANIHKVKALREFQRFRIDRVKADRAEAAVISREILERALAGLAAMFIAPLDEVHETVVHQLAGDPAINAPLLKNWAHDVRRRLAEQQTIELSRAIDAAHDEAEGKTKGRGRRGA